MNRSIALHLTLSVLLMSAIHASLRIADASDARRHRRAFDAQIPPDSSLGGVDGAGNIVSPAWGAGGELTGSYLLVFAIHSRQAGQDIAYWNRVIELVSRAPAAPAIEYWGICDMGNACDAPRPAARFRILGYLEPYQMRIAASAEAIREALLYRDDLRLQSRVKVLQDPAAEAQAILLETR